MKTKTKNKGEGTRTRGLTPALGTRMLIFTRPATVICACGKCLVFLADEFKANFYSSWVSLGFLAILHRY